jgi:hypothetical protein
MQQQESHCVTIATSYAIAGLSRCADEDQPKLADNALKISVFSAITDRHIDAGACLSVLIALEGSAINAIINGFRGILPIKA